MKSDQLRKVIEENGGGRIMNNAKAKKLEKNILDCVLQIKKDLEKKYPSYTFRHEKNLSKEKIASSLGIKNYKPSNAKSSIKPDGGIIYIEDGAGRLYPILIAEAKKQGTNDERKKEGKKKQAQGNAIERAYKNFYELKLFCKNINYFPYVVFVSGCDFAQGSSIIDRLDAMTEYKPRNEIHVKDEAKIATLFMKETSFDMNEVYEVMNEVANTSIKELLKNYDK